MSKTSDLKDYKEITNLLISNYLKEAISGRGSEMRPTFHSNAKWYGYVGQDLIAGPIQTLYDCHNGNGAATDLV